MREIFGLLKDMVAKTNDCSSSAFSDKTAIRGFDIKSVKGGSEKIPDAGSHMCRDLKALSTRFRALHD